jgi:hypothetical protein
LFFSTIVSPPTCFPLFVVFLTTNNKYIYIYTNPNPQPLDINYGPSW